MSRDHSSSIGRVVATRLSVHGHEAEAAILETPSGLWVHFEGQTRFLPIKRARRGAGAAQELSDPAEIRAPMPGKIVKVQRQTNDRVQAGDIVVVMEAMKMEYTLRAATNGIVKAIDCQVGQQVTLGAKLVRLEVEANP